MLPTISLYFYGFLIFTVISSCAPVISREMRLAADSSIKISDIQKMPEKHTGRIVMWGGDIVEIKNTDSGTRIEVVKRPLDFEGRPKSGDESSGRFMALSPKYLESIIYKKGRKITIAGAIGGVQIDNLDEGNYPYPMIEVQEIYLWPQRISPYGNYESLYPYWPHYRGTFFHHWRCRHGYADPFCDPFWR